MIDDVRGLLPLADPVHVARILEKNPDIIRSVTVPGQSEASGIFAYLPLNAYGAWALMAGRYDGSKPDPAWICFAGGKPSAIAIWLIVAPGLLIRMFEPIARLFRALCPEGCAIFSYGATDASASIQRAVGFRPAQEMFPGAPTHLVAACPDSAVPIDIARNIELEAVAETMNRIRADPRHTDVEVILDPPDRQAHVWALGDGAPKRRGREHGPNSSSYWPRSWRRHPTSPAFVRYRYGSVRTGLLR